MSGVMYGSIHTHFESRYDTANQLKKMIGQFIATGARRVAATEHGVFSSYEDLLDLSTGEHGYTADAKELIKFAESEGFAFPSIENVTEDFNEAVQKQLVELIAAPKKFKENFQYFKEHADQVAILLDTINNFEILPGIEGYFGENKAHLILVAKDYEGYLSLCKIISESNEWLRDNDPKGSKAVITMDNLKKNVAKGHIVCTSACIAGPFGQLFGLQESNYREKVEKTSKELEESGFYKFQETIDHYESVQKEQKAAVVRKKELADAEKAKKKNGDEGPLLALAQRAKRAEEMKTWLDQNERAYNAAVDNMKILKKQRYGMKVTMYEKNRALLNETVARRESGESNVIAKELLTNFVDVFGENDFYFELQNHGLNKEKEIYNNVVRFAVENKFPHFIASNDIHVGVRKNDPAYEDALYKRNIIKFTRFNKYDEESADDREYVIKSDAEIAEELSKSLEDANEEWTKDRIISEAIGNIESSMKDTGVSFEKSNHYPKFCDDENAEFERRVREGLKERFPNGFPDERYEKRLEYELDVIKTMGYAGYHLIVADYLEYGRLLGFLPTKEEVENAPNSVEELKAYIKNRNYPMVGYNIGPGRGSAVGSLCCYGMGITDIDPIPYDLLFERFLNVERVSMPDIDSDFRTDIRARVVDYCRAKYGSECICQIMTKSYGAIKGNLRLAARYLGSKAYSEQFGELLDIDFDIDEYGNLVIPEDYMTTAEKNEHFKKFMKSWYDMADRLSKGYDEDNEFDNVPNVTDTEKEIISIAKLMNGAFTGYGQHAAGTIISGHDVRKIIPLMWNSKKGSMETQCTMAQAEAKGLLKMDFLGLNNLDIITDIVRFPTRGIPVNNRHLYASDEEYKKAVALGQGLDNILQDYTARDRMLQDPAIYERIFQSGLTQGVFQFESDGMKTMLKNFKPESFGDIILLVAAYRPGPMDYIPEIIATKWYKKDPEHYEEIVEKFYPKKDYPNLYPVPKSSITIQNEALDNILSSTYHCPIYQEQIMKIFQEMAGYSLGGADMVRRAMSKKKVEVLEKEKEAFIHGDPERGIAGCMAKQGLTEKEAGDLFEQMMPFAKYGFNKSHATAYAMVSMFTAYLKVYHTADFFRSSLKAIKELKEIPPFVAEMRHFGITFKGPSMTDSENEFTVEDQGKTVRYGLKYVKGFSEQNYHRSKTVQGFMDENPGISLKILEKYAQLGMFIGAWEYDIRRNHNIGNRHAHLAWIANVAPTYQKYQEKVEKHETLVENLGELEKRIDADPANAELEKAYNKLKNDIAKVSEERAELAKTLNELRASDFSEPSKVESLKEQLENRAWETEMLSMPFSIENSKKALKNSKNYYTFENLQLNDGRTQSLPVPAIVLSVSAQKLTKNKNPYYDVSLMDRNGAIISRRFDSVPDVLDGVFKLPVESCKFFNVKMAEYKPIEEKERKTVYTPLTSGEKMVAAIKNGGTFQNVSIGRNKAVPFIIGDQPVFDDQEIEDR